MEKIPNKIKLLLVIFLLIAVGVVAYFWLYQEKPARLEVIFFDIGQGDAILIKTPDNQQILIDGGPDDQILVKLGKYMPLFDKSLDLVILSHPHADHIAGLVSVLDNYQVDQVFYTGVDYTNPDYTAWLETLDQNRITTTVTKAGDVINLGPNLQLMTLFPFTALTGQSVEDLNSSSIVSRLVYEEYSFLFTGDLLAEQERELLAAKVDLSADVLKVSHHGSKYSSVPDFLEAVQADYAVIQVGADNKFGHPNLFTIKNLEEQNMSILRNDKLGDIKCIVEQSVLSCNAI